MIRPTERSRIACRRRGVAALLVIIAVAIAAVLSLSFLAAQATTSSISTNQKNRTQARQIAESAMQMTLQTINSSSTWRTEYASGQWLTDEPLFGGTFSVRVDDGTYNSATGLVEGDGDFANNSTDSVTILATGSYNGATHTVRMQVNPSEPVSSVSVLMIVGNDGWLTDSETKRKLLIESWGWQVSTLHAGASTGDYDNAIALAHVIYVPEDGGSSSVGSKLSATEMGVVFEDGDLFSPLGLSTSQTSYTGSAISIVDNTHYITSPFGIGDLTIATTTGQAEVANGTIVGGLRPLAWWPGTEKRVLAALDTGQLLSSGSPAPGRRAALPFAGFEADELTANGQQILRRALEWSAQSSSGTDTVEALDDWTTDSSVSLVDGEDRLLVVTVGAETHASITSMTYGYQEMTLVASAYESTGVGARSYIYILRESSLAVASDSTLRSTWTSGSRADTSYASRLYANVNQASPVRTSEWATNAGPATITCAAMEVSPGDMAISAVRVGHENRNYTWTGPLIEGTESKLSTSTHTSADYPVAGSTTSVVAEATCNAPNRQAMVAAVIQPRSLNNGSGVLPTLLTLYEFEEQPPVATLVGHWPLDDDGSGGAIAIQDSINLSGSSRIEGYRSSAGVYGGTNSQLDVTLVTNTSSYSGISVSGSAVLQGSTYNRPGANPTNVVSISGSGQITGNRYEQSVQFSLPSLAAPTGMPASSGNRSLSSGNTTISADVTYADLTLSSNATLTINGDVRIHVTDDLAMSGNAKIIINSGSRLRLYVADDVTLSTSSKINDASDAPSRFELYQYGSGSDMILEDNATISGILSVKRDVRLDDDAILYGVFYFHDDLDVNNNASLRVDLDQMGFGITPVTDAAEANDAQAHDDVAFAQAGARAYTGTAMKFDGVNDFVRIAHHDNYLVSHGTVSFWFNSSSLSGTRALFSKDSSNYDTGGHLHIYTDGNTLYARLQSNGEDPYGSGDNFTVSSSGLSTGTWYHVTVTFGAGGLRLYRDATLREQVSYPGGMGPNSGGLGNYQPIVLGAGTTGAGDLTHLPVNEHFNGYLDDVRIYDAVLDATQITQVYQGQPLGDRTEPSYLVADTSGQGAPLNLSIDDTQAVAWVVGEGLAINQSTVIRSAELPEKIRNGITATGEFTLELIATASDVASNGRILRYGSINPSNQNFEISQNTTTHRAAIRTSDTGSSPAPIESQNGATVDTRHHVIVTFKEETLRIYRDGALIDEIPHTGHLLTWDSLYGLTLANLPDATAPWRGTLHHIAIYDRAMNTRQSNNLFNNLPPGDGGSTPTGPAVRWIESQ